MPRYFYFRDNVDVTCGCICHNLTDVILSVESSVWVRIVFCTVESSYLCRIPESSDFSQFRIFLYFNAPTLIVSQVPVEGVHLEACHLVHQLFYDSLAFKITSFIEHKRTYTKSGCITDAQLVYGSVIFSNDLSQSLDSIEYTGSGRRFNSDSFLIDSELIGFFVVRGSRVAAGQYDVAFAGVGAQLPVDAMLF